MKAILKVVGRARRRMIAVEFVRLLVAGLFWAGIGCAILILVQRWTGPLPLFLWAVAAAAPLPAALVLAILRRPSIRSAALALDQAAGLEERVSAALHVRDDPSPAAQAVLRNAEEAVLRSEGSVPFGRPRLRWLALPAALVAAAFFLPLPGTLVAGTDGLPPPEAFLPVPEPVRKKQSARLRRRAFDLEKRAKELDKPELKKLGSEMRKTAEQLRKKQITRNEALAKVSNLEEKARRERDRIGEKYPKDLRKRLKSLAGEGGKKGAQSELGKKIEELSKAARALSEKLDSQDMTPEERNKMEEEARELGEALEEQFGDDEPFADLLGKLSDLLDQGDERDWDDFLDSIEDLEDALADLEALELLDGELEDLFAMKDDFSEEEGTCLFCGGAARGGGACGRCAGLFGGAGVGPGAGAGLGPGQGPKGKHDPDTEQSPTRVKGNLTPGDIIGAIQFKTLPAKGEVKSSYVEAFQRASAEEAEALQHIEIPPGYRLHVRDYFDSIRPDKKK